MFKLSILPHHKLITSGPYAIVRHLSYMTVILVLGRAIFVHSARGALAYECPVVYYLWSTIWWLFMAISCAMMVDRCIWEDELLRGAFGEEWGSWCWRVRWRLVPWIY